MAVVPPPPRDVPAELPDVGADPEALIGEARRRQRRRRVIASLLVAVGVLAAGIVYAVVAGSSPAGSPHASPGRFSVATGALFPKQPGALALTSDGGLLIADDSRNQILERLPSGRFTVIAGTGRHGFAGDGGAAVDAALNAPTGLAVAADGSIFFADQQNNRIRKITPSGVITTVAGSGKTGRTKTGTPALAAPLISPAAVAFGPRALLYIADTSGVFRLERDGTLTRLAGVRAYGGVYGIGDLATKASADGPAALAFDRAGNLYIAGLNTKTLLMIDTSRRMRLPAGRTGFYPRTLGGGLVTAPSGHVFAINTQEIEELSLHGVRVVYSFEGRKVSRISGFLPAGIAVGPNGVIYTDTGDANGWTTGGRAIVAISPSKTLSVLWHK